MSTAQATSHPFRLSPLRIIRAALLAVLTFVVGIAVLAALFLWLIMNVRITVNPQAISTLAHDGVVIALAKGKPDQKIQTIKILDKMGTDAKPFVPSLVAAAHEGDLQIRAAALHALENIDPQAAKDSRDTP